MSYEFTKLGAVEALTEMPENANALVEVDGAIKRVPASSLVPAPSEVVILPETVLTLAPDADVVQIATPLQAPVSADDTVSITYNGTAYECVGVSLDASTVAFGNLSALGTVGGNPDAPFAVALVPEGAEQDNDGVISYIYGVVIPMDGSTTITLSIVQVGAASGGDAGGGVVMATAVIGDGPSVTSIDKTYSELLSAVKAGKYVQMMAKIGTSITAMPFVFWMDEGDSGYMLFSVEAKTVAAAIQYNADGTAEWAQ